MVDVYFLLAMCHEESIHALYKAGIINRPKRSWSLVPLEKPNKPWMTRDPCLKVVMPRVLNLVIHLDDYK